MPDERSIAEVVQQSRFMASLGAPFVRLGADDLTRLCDEIERLQRELSECYGDLGVRDEEAPQPEADVYEGTYRGLPSERGMSPMPKGGKTLFGF